MALNKSSSNKWLGIHCFIYALPFLYFGFKFALVAGISHFVIDYVTSRVNANLWKQGKRGMFFKNIGFDQALHMTVLFLML
jgi:phage-related holin